MKLIQTLIAGIIAAFALNANAADQTCTTDDGTKLSAVAPATSASAPAKDDKSSCEAKKVAKPAPAKKAKAADTGDQPSGVEAMKAMAAARARVEAENAKLREQLAARLASAAPAMRSAELTVPLSNAAPRTGDVFVTVHTQKVQCLLRVNGEIVERTFQNSIPACDDWQNGRAMSLGLIDTKVKTDAVSQPIATTAPVAQPTATGSGQTTCELRFEGKVVDTATRPSEAECRAWTEGEAAKRGWIPAAPKVNS